jgi:hypothetical protein
MLCSSAQLLRKRWKKGASRPKKQSRYRAEGNQNNRVNFLVFFCLKKNTKKTLPEKNGMAVCNVLMQETMHPYQRRIKNEGLRGTPKLEYTTCK